MRWAAPGTATPKPTRSRPRSRTTRDSADEVKLGAGEDVDFKQYEAGMRYLLDTYIQADATEIVAELQGHRSDRADRASSAPGRSTSCPRA